MIRRKRNYASEYSRRIERAQAKGLSRSQARGHAKPGEAWISPHRVKANSAPLEAALKALHAGGNLQRAARDNHISAERLKKYLADRGLARRVGRKWQITDTRRREMTVLSAGRAQNLILKNFENASLNGRHLAAVGQFLESNDAQLLIPFEGQSVIDASDVPHIFETDPNILYRIAQSGGEVYEQVYRLIQ
jgi:hypothetical protein